MTRRLMITVDVEAQPARAERDHVDRLIWGHFPEGRAGIGEMMDIADRHGVKLGMFLDYCEEHLYGEALLDVGREIVRRGHDLELHAHLNFLRPEFWAERGLAGQSSLNEVTADQAAAVFDFLCERHEAVAGHKPLAFRGGGYRINAATLDAMAQRGIVLDTSVNVTRALQSFSLPVTKQFLWANGCLEVPVSSVFGFHRLQRNLDFNFNSAKFPNEDSLLEYLEAFYVQHGEDAVAVMVMHSWSFLQLVDRKYFTKVVPTLLEKFDKFIARARHVANIVTPVDVVSGFRDKTIRPGLTVAFTEPAGSASPGCRVVAGTEAATAEVVGAPEKPRCPICGTDKERFQEMNGRRCPQCGSLERQRCFALAYNAEICSSYDLAGRNVRIFSPAQSELMFFEQKRIVAYTAVDIRPEFFGSNAKNILIADVCDLKSVADDSCECVFASYLMPGVYDLERALEEIARVLAPRGTFFSVELLAAGKHTVEIGDGAEITAFYGQEVLDKYQVGSFRILGELDYRATLSRRFAVAEHKATDPITGYSMTIYACTSLKEGGEDTAVADTRFSAIDEAFDAYLKKNPHSSYAEFSVRNQLASVQSGRLHPTLGLQTQKYTDFWEAGASSFSYYRGLLGVSASEKLVDYGCGSLRLGCHFINYLVPDSYFGLDVIDDFIGMGKTAIGAALLEEKRPSFGAISEAALSAGEQFGADFVISTACAFQIHPDEKQYFIANLKRLGSKPGCIIAFDTKIAAELIRYRTSCWAWPLKYYREAFAPMVLLQSRTVSNHDEGGHVFMGQVLVFGHEGAPEKALGVPQAAVPKPTATGKGGHFLEDIDASFQQLLNDIVLPDLVHAPHKPALLPHGRLSEKQGRHVRESFAVLPPVVDSWRELVDPDTLLRAVEVSGCRPDSIDLFVSTNILDFLEEQAAMLQNVARALRPGGYGIFRIKRQRVIPGAEPARVAYQIAPESVGLPAGSSLPSVQVGRAWLLSAMAAAGFDAQSWEYLGEGSGETIEWFVGRWKSAGWAEPSREADPQLAAQAGTTPSLVCGICGAPYIEVPAGGAKCPGCQSLPRTRSLVPVLNQEVRQLLSGAEGSKTLLAFAMTDPEKRVLSTLFDEIHSVSLYGSYRTGHTTGVDIRDLGRYPDACFDGVFGILVFDYFIEHEQALAEVSRVLKPGGVLFTQIAPYRLLSDAQAPPKVTSIIKKKKAYFEYVPDDADMPSVNVGAGWLVKAMDAAGLEASHIEVKDELSGENLNWFIGAKRGGSVATVVEFVPKASLLPVNRFNLFFSFPRGGVAYYRNVRCGFVSVLQAIDRLALEQEVYEESLGGNTAAIRKRFAISEEDIPGDWLTFTIVRNPYRRLVAAYNYGIVSRGFISEDNLFSTTYRRFGFSEETDFASFVRAVVSVPTDQADDYISPQSHLVFHPGGKRARFIARLESIAEDWLTVARRYGVNVALPHSNTSSRKVAWTRELRDLAYDYYLDDFRVFGYDREGLEVADGASPVAPMETAAQHFSKDYARQCAQQFAADNEAVRAEVGQSPAAAMPLAREDAGVVSASCPEKEFSIPLPLATGFDRIVIRLSIPSVPAELGGADFAEHVIGPDGAPTDQVILCGKGRFGVSDDLGKTWKAIQLDCADGVRLWNSFTRADGGHILQAVGWQGNSEGEPDPDRHGKLFIFDRNWKLVGTAKAGIAYWHGSASISQSGDVIMYAEYHNNSERYQSGFDPADKRMLEQLRPSAVWRSRDGGLSWQKVFEVDCLTVRHFHTLQADPFVLRKWWLSSGDMALETYVWCSEDDGDTWRDVTNPDPNVSVPASFTRSRRSCQRYTDVAILEDSLLWGADDYMGELADLNPSLPLELRGGSRMYASLKTQPLVPREIGYIGHPVRSMIDVGPGWIILTEAKDRDLSLRPAVYLLFKNSYNLVHLLNIDNYSATPTGFSFSRSSRKAKDGTFFSFRSSNDVFPYSTERPRVLAWNIEFV